MPDSQNNDNWKNNVIQRWRDFNTKLCKGIRASDAKLIHSGAGHPKWHTKIPDFEDNKVTTKKLIRNPIFIQMQMLFDCNQEEVTARLHPTAHVHEPSRLAQGLVFRKGVVLSCKLGLWMTMEITFGMPINSNTSPISLQSTGFATPSEFKVWQSSICSPYFVPPAHSGGGRIGRDVS